MQFRPPLELKETLLHEMIHAWVRLTHQKDRGPGSNSGHGSAFQAKMLHINTCTLPDYQARLALSLSLSLSPIIPHIKHYILTQSLCVCESIFSLCKVAVILLSSAHDCYAADTQATVLHHRT